MDVLLSPISRAKYLPPRLPRLLAAHTLSARSSVPRVLVGFPHHRSVWGQPYRHDPRVLHPEIPGDEDLRLE